MEPTTEPTVEPTPEPTTEPSGEPAGNTGPTTVSGTLTYTNAFFTLGVAQPVILLEDEGGFVDRNRTFVMSPESQVLGKFTSDFFTSPVNYSLSLPVQPQGTLHDVNHDGKTDPGVMIFATAYWTNVWGDPYLERRDLQGGGWSSAYASTRVSSDPNNYLEWTGGKVLVFAPDGNEQYPSGFGDDKKLFTDDDPMMDVPQGWSVIDMDQTPFAIDRSTNPTMDLIEPDTASLDDFSGMSYSAAFDAMIQRFEALYPFTQLKKIDWQAESDKFRPEFVAAEQANDQHAYQKALQDFLFSIPDVHIGADLPLLNDDFQKAIAGGLGFAMAQTDDGKFVVSFLTPGGSAAKAGIKLGAQILDLNGVPTEQAVASDVPWSSPFSTKTSLRLQQLRYALRFPLATGKVPVGFQNPNGKTQLALLDVVQEFDSFSASSFYAGQSPTELPVEFKVLPDGMGYVKVDTFSDNEVLMIQLWERAIAYLNGNNSTGAKLPGLIVDMRQNRGGDGWLAEQMAAYFFKQDTFYGTSFLYNSPGNDSTMIPPRADLQYDGKVVLMVGPGCVSACEFFARGLTIDNRATVVGQYPTAGGGGSVDEFLMPMGLLVEMPIGKTVDKDGNVVIEGTGIVPTVKVPVTVSTVIAAAKGTDVVLNAAEKEIESEAGAGG